MPRCMYYPYKGFFQKEAAHGLYEHRLEKDIPIMDGIQIEFVGQVGSRLNTKSLEAHRKDIYLLNERLIEVNGGLQAPAATVHLPRGKANAFFADKITAYRDDSLESGNPKNDLLVRSIEAIQPASIESFWYGNGVALPDSSAIWCEVWVLQPDKQHQKQVRTNSVKRKITAQNKENDSAGSFRNICQSLSIEYGESSLVFPEQEVFLVKANREQLQDIVDSVAFFHPSAHSGNLQDFGWNCPRANKLTGLII